MALDGTTLQDLGLVSDILPLIDKTATAFGSRRLRSWLLAPLCDPAAINARLGALGPAEICCPLLGHFLVEAPC